MSVQIVQEKLSAYNCQSTQEEMFALREITQELVLTALSRSDFFKVAAFQGGTCLRILHSLDRFSEDLDFVLKETNNRFDLVNFLKNIEIELNAYGYEPTFKDRSTIDASVKKGFIKDTSIGKLLELHYVQTNSRPKAIRIKIEVDTNPPAGSHYETRRLDWPLAFAVTLQDLPSLFAGKCHALLCREYVKGRDWYDLLWYVARKVPINALLLKNALVQQGPWKDKKLTLNDRWLQDAFQNKIQSVDWKEAKQDIQRFLKPNQLQQLDQWNEKFFLETVSKINQQNKPTN